ncbi:DUF475 domain-containing protein [Nitratireductor sp. XY-223]|uniref:DUF475 domain-containing protein n=1 Tax=Nitratireductor sp. XY-223 TaxID=2561926 RepID=UPI0010AAEA1D|nr:DUF475 domain-containing protein [Nitratireductor sp. XY-223]
MKLIRTYFFWPLLVTIAGLIAVFWIGWNSFGTLAGATSFFIIGAVLAIMEISLSFDNAIVNANKLKYMTPKWQQRFLTWGILIAVFGMRIVFPVLIVAIAAKLGPIAAVKLAVLQPDEYSRIISESHISIAAFGGTFLMMVALSYFINEEKEVDWFKMLEKRLRQWASIRGLEIAFVLAVIIGFAWFLKSSLLATFLMSAMLGLLTYLLVELLGNLLDRAEEARDLARAGGFGAFMYLEVLDASFSFDGVIGAFAFTKNLFLIAIGLGIGAMYVRTMTIMLVEKNTLAQFRYLEHGAFYSIFLLSVIMFTQSMVHIPELITGFIGVALIGLALIESIRYNRLHPEGDAS